MIDSVLKGTGNSRFLKSAVPAGTSWADALAMLQAGTFPIDFNGINTEGFQQVGTPLNKANLLKDATAAQIGLPPSTTPDGMFQALGNTGELHVWRKTVTTAQEIPAGYTLGTMETNIPIACNTREASQFQITREYGDSISVDDAGSVSIVGSTTDTTWAADSYIYNYWNGDLRGKFVRLTISGNILGYDGVLFIPSDATFSVIQSTNNASGTNCATLFVSKAQKVNAYPLTPAGTTTTYPVSTNPKAYQEGNDAKAAGYVVGEAVSGLFRINRVYYSTTIHYANSVNVADDGTVTLAGQSGYGLSAEENSYNNAKKLAGKFIVADYDHNYCKIPKGVVLFLPTNTTISFRQDVPGDEGYGIFFDRYQPVTGYAAIPAGTTIEYLGKLGDKARVQVVSYVGTGTYGSDNPQSVSVDFKIKAILFLGYVDTIYGFYSPFANDSASVYVIASILKTSYTPNMGLSWNSRSSSYGKISEDGKTFTWYTSGRYADLNSEGNEYFFLVIG